MRVDFGKKVSSNLQKSRHKCSSYHLMTESQIEQQYLLKTSCEDQLMMKLDQQDNQTTQSRNSEPIQKKPKIKKRNPINPNKRDGNSIASNTSRDFKNLIKTSLKENTQLYSRFLKWIQDNKVFSQVWAFDALCFKLTYFRDLKFITNEDYLTIFQDLTTNLEQKLKHHTEPSSIRKIQCYQSHISKYIQSEFSFQKIPDLFDQSKDNFDGLFKIRTATKIQCIHNLKEIYQKMSQGKIIEETDLETFHFRL